MMAQFFDAIDVSTNILRARAAIRNIYDIQALFLAVVLGVIVTALVPAVWYFDLDSTTDWTTRAAGDLVTQLPTEWSAAVVAITLAITLLPSAIEMFTVRFAQAKIIFFAHLIYAFSVFDLVTDWPRVYAFVNRYQDAADQLGLFAGPAMWVARVLFLILASFGFEVILICCLFAIWDLYRQSTVESLQEYEAKYGKRASLRHDNPNHNQKNQQPLVKTS